MASARRDGADGGRGGGAAAHRLYRLPVLHAGQPRADGVGRRRRAEAGCVGVGGGRLSADGPGERAAGRPPPAVQLARRRDARLPPAHTHERVLEARATAPLGRRRRRRADGDDGARRQALAGRHPQRGRVAGRDARRR